MCSSIISTFGSAITIHPRIAVLSTNVAAAINPVAIIFGMERNLLPSAVLAAPLAAHLAFTFGNAAKARRLAGSGTHFGRVKPGKNYLR